MIKVGFFSDAAMNCFEKISAALIITAIVEWGVIDEMLEFHNIVQRG